MRPTILVVDDSPSVRSILKVYLLGVAGEIHEAETAHRGLQLVGLLPVNLVIADVRMPGMGGLEFTAALRSDPRPGVGDVPVVLLTAEREAGLRERGLAAGANAFLSKPVSPEELTRVVTMLTGGLGQVGSVGRP